MEPFAKIPMWLELSGLPAAMNDAAKLQAAWSVFCKIVALDCQRNPSSPSHVAISLRDLGEACGITPGAATRIAQSLQKKKWIACFIPDNEEEEALFQVKVPLPTPTPAEQLKQAHPGLFPNPEEPLRYESSTEESTREADPSDPILHEVIDLYFNSISMKMNGVILDELLLVRRRFELALIRRIFARAKKHGITSMSWLLRELHRETAKKIKKEMGLAVEGEGEDTDGE